MEYYNPLFTEWSHYQDVVPGFRFSGYSHENIWPYYKLMKYLSLLGFELPEQLRNDWIDKKQVMVIIDRKCII